MMCKNTQIHIETFSKNFFLIFTKITPFHKKLSRNYDKEIPGSCVICILKYLVDSSSDNRYNKLSCYYYVGRYITLYVLVINFSIELENYIIENYIVGGNV